MTLSAFGKLSPIFPPSLCYGRLLLVCGAVGHASGLRFSCKMLVSFKLKNCDACKCFLVDMSVMRRIHCVYMIIRYSFAGETFNSVSRYVKVQRSKLDRVLLTLSKDSLGHCEYYYISPPMRPSLLFPLCAPHPPPPPPPRPLLLFLAFDINSYQCYVLHLLSLHLFQVPASFSLFLFFKFSRFFPLLLIKIFFCSSLIT